MGDRFNIRSKCLTWPNVRSQVGISESVGVTQNSSDGNVPYDITDPNEGRLNDDDYRRNNEDSNDGCVNVANNEMGWQNQVRRDAESFSIKDDIPASLENQPTRDYLFEDWENMKNEGFYTGED